jgi:hypothetical protein
MENSRRIHLNFDAACVGIERMGNSEIMFIGVSIRAFFSL